MSNMQDLPPDHRAVLSLLLRQRRSYAEIAGMLSISEQAVHDRAQAALLLLSPRLARELDPERREEIGDYLLGQQTPAETSITNAYLTRDPTANAWAQDLHAQLQTLSSGALPAPPSQAQQPTGRTTQPAPAPRPASAPRTAASSKRGGAVLLGVLVIVVIVAVVLILNAGGKGGKSNSNSATSTNTITSTSNTAGAGGSSSESSTASTGTKSEPHVDAQLNLKSPSGASSGLGVAYVLSDGKQRAFYLIAEHLAKTEGFFYAVWLENSAGEARPLGKTPSVSSNGRLRTAGPLPTNAGSFDKILLTRETDEKAKTPGERILEGAFKLS